jgi:hypothetical protein
MLPHNSYASAQEYEQRREELLAWLWLHESTVLDALKLCVERLPSHLISKYERALDSFPKESVNKKENK